MNDTANNPDRRLLEAVFFQRLLSFGPDSKRVDLGSLNVLIGPNASGKSNFIEGLSLLRSTPQSSGSKMDLHETMRTGGGAKEWIWKFSSPESAALLQVFVKYGDGRLWHSFTLDPLDRQTDLLLEFVSATPDGPAIYRSKKTGAVIVPAGGQPQELPGGSIDTSLSILAQRRDPERYPELAFLAERYERICIYREWTFGRKTILRQPQPADARNDRLEEDFSNLGLFLSRIARAPKVKAALLDGLKDLYDGVTDFQVYVEGGSVQVFFSEGDISIPATRLSDGTLRYLCLLAILCDANPPPLICIEEPELGLHPDVLPKLADLFVEASRRTQLIVTTHSDVLIDCFTERPEVIVVCEKVNGQTQMRRLDKADLAGWLDKYRLGQLWTSGQIGGTRW